jgi:dipeptidyl aminopeptidase/acylaminoacyl peptidase
MIIAGSKDEILGTVDSEAYDRLLKSHPGHRYVLLDGLGHYFRAPEEQEQLVRETRRWLVDVQAFAPDKKGTQGTGKIKIKL